MGGAIIGEGELMITESTMTGNAADTGGAIYNFGGRLTITGSTLNENAAEYGLVHKGNIVSYNTLSRNNGGAIQNSWGSLTITESTLTGNTAKGDGGAINNFKEESFSIENCRLENNEPNDVGYNKDN